MADITKFIPDQFNLDSGILFAILQAVTNSTGRLEDMIQAAIDQQFISTATGRYLLFLGEQSGFTLPSNSGLDIDALKQLVPIMVASPKQVAATLEALVEVFYGVDKTRATITCTAAEPYSFANGDDLIITTENGEIPLSFTSDQFSNIGSVTAQEIAGVLNSQQDQYIAEVFYDRRQNKKFVRVISKTPGTSGFLRVTGGTAQNILRFPKLVPIANTTGTGFVVTKPSQYSDLVTIQWDGINGINPNFYLTEPGDTLTIRGLVDGTYPLSKLDGSYKIIDAGYDYIVFRDLPFTPDAAFFLQPDDNTLVITSQINNTIYDQEEYAILSETENSTVSVVVPAIPPLARRFLKGSAHLHGQQAFVLSFTRSTVTIDNSTLDSLPRGVNSLVFDNQNFRQEFTMADIYKTTGSDEGTPTTFSIDTGTFGYNVFPYTSPQPIKLSLEVGSSEITVDAGSRHGMHHKWAATINAPTGASNLTSAALTGEFIIGKILDRETFIYESVDSLGRPIRFNGVTVSNVDVYRQPSAQADGSDFYLQFPDQATATASGLVPGMTFKFDTTIGVNNDAYYGNRLRLSKSQVIQQVGSVITFRSGFGYGPTGKVMTATTLHRSTVLTDATFFFDQFSAYNADYVMKELRVTYAEYTPESNPLYVGSFLYDPQGTYYPLTIGGNILTNAQPILKGSNQVSVFVTSTNDFPSSGKMMIDYGTSLQEGPIDYLSVIQNDLGDSQVLIDPAYKFKFSHKPGAQIWNVLSTHPFVPNIDGRDFPAYMTGTAQARNTLLTLIQLLVAAGVFVDFEVLFPNLRFSDTAIQPFA